MSSIMCVIYVHELCWEFILRAQSSSRIHASFGNGWVDGKVDKTTAKSLPLQYAREDHDSVT